MNLVQKDQGVVISDIEDRFGIKDMLTDKSKDNTSTPMDWLQPIISSMVLQMIMAQLQ